MIIRKHAQETWIGEKKYRKNTADNIFSIDIAKNIILIFVYHHKIFIKDETYL